MGVRVEKVAYGGWPDCYRLSNDLVELIATTDVGPRLIRFGFVGMENEFKEYESMLGKKGGKDWRIYGGHRLWVAPEHKRFTYIIDNTPVALERRPGFLRLTQRVERETGIQKEMDVRLSPTRAQVKVVHRLRNTARTARTVSPWALSVMAQGGVAIVPLPPREAHREHPWPTNTITLWAYTDMGDPRWRWGAQYVMLRQDPALITPQKAGFSSENGWVAYVRSGHLFVIRFRYFKGASYPDMGSSVELFTNADMLELETLGPLIDLQPGAEVEHVEQWFLFRDVPTPENEADVVQHILPRVEQTKVRWA